MLVLPFSLRVRVAFERALAKCSQSHPNTLWPEKKDNRMLLTLRRIGIAVAILPLVLAAAHADPLISAWIGTQTSTSKVGYFVMDFNDTGANPETYAFGWNYEGTKTDADFIQELAASLTGTNGFVQEGIENNFLTKLGYSGREKFNDFGGNNSGDPDGFWSLWQGFDGLTWTSSQFGATDVRLSDTPLYTFNTFTGQNELSGSSWHGWRWEPEFAPDAPAPRTPLTGVVVPEAGTLVLGLMGIAGAGLMARRHK